MKRGKQRSKEARNSEHGAASAAPCFLAASDREARERWTVDVCAVIPPLRAAKRRGTPVGMTALSSARCIIRADA